MTPACSHPGGPRARRRSSCWSGSCSRLEPGSWSCPGALIAVTRGGWCSAMAGCGSAPRATAADAGPPSRARPAGPPGRSPPVTGTGVRAAPAAFPMAAPIPSRRSRPMSAAAVPGPVRAGLQDVITSAIPSAFQRHQVLWELDARPALLTGEGAHGSPRVNVLVRALADAGVPGIVVPACPSCGQAVPLRFRLGEVRCCRRCYDRDRLEACSRCGRAGDVASRTAAGDAVCSACFRRDPANHGQCSNCGRTALTVLRDDGTAWCRRCYRVPTATCSLCGRDKPCYLASAGTPRCEHCSRRMRHAPCARCGSSRAVWTRTADGQPLCGSCSRQRVPCSTCGKTRTVAARLPAGPLCSTCYRKDPASFRPCTGCGATERLYHHGLCIRCACREHLLGLLSHEQGGMHPHAEAIYHVLAGSDPAPLMQWLTTSAAAGVLAGYQPGRPPARPCRPRPFPARQGRPAPAQGPRGQRHPARPGRAARRARAVGHGQDRPDHRSRRAPGRAQLRDLASPAAPARRVGPAPHHHRAGRLRAQRGPGSGHPDHLAAGSRHQPRLVHPARHRRLARRRARHLLSCPHLHDLGEQPRPRRRHRDSPARPQRDAGPARRRPPVGTGPQPAPRRVPCRRGPRRRAARPALRTAAGPHRPSYPRPGHRFPGRRHAPARHHAGRTARSPGRHRPPASSPAATDAPPSAAPATTRGSFLEARQDTRSPLPSSKYGSLPSASTAGRDATPP